MKRSLTLVCLALAVCHTGWAQRGQEGSGRAWPCVPGRPVDSSYLEITESTGGQLFLFQKGEMQHSATVMSAPYSHPATLLRAVGQIADAREFEVPVDSTTTSILVMASLQCRQSIAVLRPGGSEMTAANSAHSLDLQAGRILRVDLPEAGTWKVRLRGTGLFVLSVLAQTPVRLDAVKLVPGRVGMPAESQVRVSGSVAGAEFHLAGPGGERLAGEVTAETLEGGRYRLRLTPPQERFRIVMTGADPLARAVLRTWPVLFRAK